MFSGSLRSSPTGSRAGDEEDDDDEEALMLGERVGGVWGPGLRWEAGGAPWGASLRGPSPPDAGGGSLDGDWEGLRDSPELAVAAATAARRRARRGVSSTRLSSADRALRPAARPLRPRPCLGGGSVNNTISYCLLNMNT